MSAAKRVRWECPNDGCKAVLGPQKPRKNNVCRYCLACSAKAGVLVERSAPSLERKRKTDAEKARDIAERKQATIERNKAKRFTVDGVDLRAVLKAAMKLPSAKPLADHLHIRFIRRGFRNHVHLKVRHSKTRSGVGGTAYNDYQIVITVGEGAHAQRAVGTLLHELAHLATLAAGENWNDSSRQFARRCHDLHDEWNERNLMGVVVDRNISGAYAGPSAAPGRRKSRYR